MGRQAMTPFAAVQDEIATLYVSIELSKSSWLVATCGALSDRISQRKLKGGDAAGLLALIGRKRAELEAAAGGPVRVLCCYEASYDGFWLHRFLRDGGVDNQVMDPASLAVERRARRAKTDRIDVVSLLRALVAWAGGDRKACRMVHVPSVQEEDEKRAHRERRRLVKERTGHINRVKALLSGQGICDFKPCRRDARARLEHLRTGDGRPLPPHLRREIERELDRLALLQEQIRSVEAARDAVLKAATAKGSRQRKIQQLARLRSIGPEFSTVLVGEIFYRSFDNRRQLAAYGGLAGCPYNSGERVREQGLSKAGNPHVRTSMVELSWMWTRYQPRSALTLWFKRRLGNATGRLKKVLIVALARKLLIALWRYLETGLVPEGAILKV